MKAKLIHLKSTRTKKMVNQVRLQLLENGSLGIGFLLARKMIVIVPSMIPDILSAVISGTSSTSVSLDQIQHDQNKSRWDLKICGIIFRLDQCDVDALRTELTKLFAH